MVGRRLNRMGNWHANAGQLHEGIGYHLEAKELFDGLKDLRGLVDTLDLLGMASAMAADPDASKAYYDASSNSSS